MPEQNEALEVPIELEPPTTEAPTDDDALARVLLRIMETDPESNVVFGNIPRGESEEYAAAVTFAEFSGSPVILRYENMKNMAKRAEAGSLLDKILNTIKVIGKTVGEAKPGLLQRFRGP
jgi:hypothetical protein